MRGVRRRERQLRRRLAAMEGAVIILDSPHYISLVMIRAKYKEGCPNGSTARSWPGECTNRGALLGLLAGAACGFAAMPPGLVAKLATFDELEAEIDGFVALCCAAN